jgi:hypothetical protein
MFLRKLSKYDLVGGVNLHMEAGVAHKEFQISTDLRRGAEGYCVVIVNVNLRQEPFDSHGNMRL